MILLTLLLLFYELAFHGDLLKTAFIIIVIACNQFMIIFNKYCKSKVFENVYIILLNAYLINNKSMIFKYLSANTTSIKNKYGSKNVCNFGGRSNPWG